MVHRPSAASTALARIRHEPAQALGKHTPIVHGLVLSRLPLLMFAHSPLNLKLRVLPEALLDARVLRRAILGKELRCKLAGEGLVGVGVGARPVAVQRAPDAPTARAVLLEPRVILLHAVELGCHHTNIG